MFAQPNTKLSSINVQQLRAGSGCFVPENTPYRAWIDRELERRRCCLADPEPSLLSFVTSVWNTPIDYLTILAESIMRQDFGAGETFEWVVVDNGSTSEETRLYLQSLAARPFIRLVRVETNLGIIGGTRLAVQHARGRYVLPVDSDDYVYPDAARIMAHTIQRCRYPALLYSDEDKLSDNRFEEAYLKPDWDPVLFVHSCYIAHLCAIDRGLAVSLGAYSDPNVSGCHDWDTFIRFMTSGFEPVHVPHVLYSWRRHSASTAGNIDSKNYIHTSHQKALTRFLASRKRPDIFRLEYSPFFNRTPDWWFRLIRPMERQIIRVPIHGASSESTDEAGGLSTDDPIRRARELLKDVQSGALIFFCDSDLLMDREDWHSETLAPFELFDDVVAVGGPVFNPAGVLSSGAVCFGFGADGLGMPDRGRPRNDPGYFAQMWKSHAVNAMTSQNLAVWSDFLLDALASEQIDGDAPISMLGEWLGCVAQRWNQRVVFSPFLGGVSREDWLTTRKPDSTDALLRWHAPIVCGDNRYYSPRLHFLGDKAYQVADPEDRNSQLETLRRRASGCDERESDRIEWMPHVGEGFNERV